jgi:hypothetical protein
MACGFFACTTAYATDATEIAPQPEGKIMDAATFADFTTALVELDLFDKESMTNSDWIDSEDYRLYIGDDEEFTIDFLTEGDSADEDRTMEEILDRRPVRNWTSTFTLSFTTEDAGLFQHWLTNNFSGSTHLDLRLSVFENGTVTISGLRATAADLKQFPDVPLFN